MKQEKVVAKLESIRKRDRELGAVLDERLERENARRRDPTSNPKTVIVRGTVRPLEDVFTAESIALAEGRPVFAITNGQLKLDIDSDDAALWRDRLEQTRAKIQVAFPSVGRLEVQGHPTYAWVGTGWLVRPDVIVTNRHVASAFARATDNRFVFRTGISGTPMGVGIDYLEEIENAASNEVRVVEVLNIADDDGPDLAFLRVAQSAGMTPIPLALSEPAVDQNVAVIGYPARDSRVPDQDLMRSLFGDAYNKKRLAPGQIDGVSSRPGGGRTLMHDCTTLGGNSGSVVVDLATGHAVGLHFGGRYLETNFAVPAYVVQEHLERIGKPRPKPVTPAAQTVELASSARTVSVTVPVTITVEVGDVRTGAPTPTSGAPSSSTSPRSPRLGDLGDGGDDGFLEGAPRSPESYSDRLGYVDTFLGKSRRRVPLPAVLRNRDEIVTFEKDGQTDSVLRYVHFSVVMRKDRRLCFFSAVNIDGSKEKKSARPGWIYDGRIPEDLQIKKECYGNSPRFSRGHMTRREDPVWGTQAVADRANADSMHVTNAVPQMQSFNAPVWLSLEEYALQNARDEDMRISVFTGPLFTDDDPEYYGVAIPLVFWKVIAFVHDDTKELSATGYSVSQEDHLRDEEFVFGPFKTYQRSLPWIETQTGLSFTTLTSHDRFGEEEAAGGLASAPLGGPDDIRW